ncbi:ABC transporter substrate-binding protein [Paenibacillus humicola]|uniref:ABC transporter substrate-binding protein n=1 Tax=Paenibacillus humicola TaxID=3110540 RepID=UPI00237BFD91|nr:extracellular solute-binding protein [Paenibacillus humicola]
MSRRKYTLLLFGVFALCAVLLVPMLDSGPNDAPDRLPPSGGQPPASNPAKTAAVTIRIGMAVDKAELRYWQEADRRFETEHPDIRIQLVNVPANDAVSEWKKASQIGDPFDVMLLASPQVADFAVNGYLLPVDDLLAGIDLSDQMEALTEPVKWNGSLWGVPFDYNPVVTVWSNALLKEAGLNGPPADWNAFTAAAKKLASQRPDLAAVNVDLSDPAEAAAWLGSFDPNAGQTVWPGLLGTAGKQQLRFAASQSRLVASLDPHAHAAELLELFRSGRLLSAVMPWSDYTALAGKAQGTLITGDKPRPSVWPGGRSLVISAQSQAPAAAGRWIGAMASSAQELAGYNTLGTLPARKSAFSRAGGRAGAVGLPEKPQALPKPFRISADPHWPERYRKWSALLAPLAGRTPTPSETERLIRIWNEEGDGGAATN